MTSGEMLFTHFGVSGPVILRREQAYHSDDRGRISALRLKPAMDEKKLDARFCARF